MWGSRRPGPSPPTNRGPLTKPFQFYFLLMIDSYETTTWLIIVLVRLKFCWAQASNQLHLALFPPGQSCVTTLGKLFTYVPLSASSITWYWSKDGDVLWLGR